jgi:hypothetical protein
LVASPTASHSTVGIGYEASWHQVEAMLLEAAAVAAAPGKESTTRSADQT